MAMKIGDVIHKGVVLTLVATTGFFASQVPISLSPICFCEPWYSHLSREKHN
jgi:hypothetical protein